MPTVRSVVTAALLGAGLADAASLTLPTAQNQTWSLSQALWRERVLIVRNPSAAYLQEMRRQDAELQVRDLRIVALLPPADARLNGPRTLTLTLLVDAGGKVGQQFSPATLVGKDGGVKATYKSLPTLQTVNALIDTMPMRLQERRERGR
ncbi:DUF4174 domain-containing protein [Deinococcus sp. QL22]|uniref:DUF4174 domain-containing protein n=1 Tax=Deinococcus sp. QL22 TaxID=2939437 RepID=UPI002017F6D5|nr:DUF4174 domain-containing protein [Deinococcus sp. QL22]UQN09615.1 DUF4174 domain-containing protein [Deinococcus sp. QL22]